MSNPRPPLPEPDLLFFDPALQSPVHGYTASIIEATLVENERLRAQLAEAQKNAERYDYLRKHSTFFDPSQNDTSFLREPPRRIWYHETPHIGADTLDAAIDAAKSYKEKSKT